MKNNQNQNSVHSAPTAGQKPILHSKLLKSRPHVTKAIHPKQTHKDQAKVKPKSHHISHHELKTSKEFNLEKLLNQKMITPPKTVTLPKPTTNVTTTHSPSLNKNKDPFNFDLKDENTVITNDFKKLFENKETNVKKTRVNVEEPKTSKSKLINHLNKLSHKNRKKDNKEMLEGLEKVLKSFKKDYNEIIDENKQDKLKNQLKSIEFIGIKENTLNSNSNTTNAKTNEKGNSLKFQLYILIVISSKSITDKRECE